jgi:predicted kinase
VHLHPQPGRSIPDPALVVLVGAAGSGKSHWAAARYLAREIVSSDRLRAVVGSGEHDLDASVDAFSLLDQIVAARARRRLTTVVDTLGLDAERRLTWLALARRSGLPAVAVLFETEPALCRTRNRSRERPVPAAVIDAQLRRIPDVRDQLAAEGWDLVLHPAETADVQLLEPGHSPGSRQAADDQRASPVRLAFVLQVSRFKWAEEPAG